MHRKFYIAILVSHLSLIVSMIFPVLKVNEIRLTPGGAGSAQVQNLNLFQYIAKEVSPITGYFMIFLLVIAIGGIVNSVYGIISKKVGSLSVKLAFVFGFSSAAMAALQLYSNSALLLIICIVTFAIISVASVKLIKMDEVQNS